MLGKQLESIGVRKPLVHAITNYVTVNDCANIILAAGASPIMADAIEEAADITAICSALVLNMGTLNARTVASMQAAGIRANAVGNPVIFDPVGAGASPYRNETARSLMETVRFSVIRGNISEIRFLASGDGQTQGVDAADGDRITEENLDRVIPFVKAFAVKTGAVVVVTGAIDILSDGSRTFIIRNGHPMMSRITGTGCMLTALIGAYVGASPKEPLEAAAAAVCAMGIAGEEAHRRTLAADGGTGMFRSLLIDSVSRQTAAALEDGARLESR